MAAKGTAAPFLAAIAHIGRLPVLRAEFFLEILADLKAVCATFGTLLSPLVAAVLADIPVVFAVVSMAARIEPAATILDDEMVPYFL